MAPLGWIDFSRSHRDKVMSVMDLFKDPGMVDELGLGTIRDAISDALFPGTSTIQTRAKYLVLIPWIIRDIESRALPGRFLKDLEEAEVHFIKVLKASSPAYFGIIGSNVESGNPKRKPSSIYWNGMRTYGILRFEGSLPDYARSAEHRRKALASRKALIAEAEGDVPGDDRDAVHLPAHGPWCELPRPPEGWWKGISIDLSAEEARFLSARMTLSQPDSLLAFCLGPVRPFAAEFSDIRDFLALPSLPDRLRHRIRVAVQFNDLMKGALLRYNLLVQRLRKAGGRDELESQWERFLREIRDFHWEGWNTPILWATYPGIPNDTKTFVERWIEHLRTGHYLDSVGDTLIRTREETMKGLRRARLRDASQAEKQEHLVGIGISESGVSYLTYRWGTVKTFLQDIGKALETHAPAR